VSMGLGPIQAIYQARFMKYMQHRDFLEQSDRKVWCFMGDGETDEPESLGAISLAGRENLDNLIFVVNCNLQRLDGPVRGNGKIIQELESVFRGAGWNVIKVVWGSYWDPLLSRDVSGKLKQRMEEVVDGQYQAYKAKDGAFVREHFFGKYPELKDMVANMSDHDIWRLNRGGHDPHKVYAAYAEAVKTTGQPTVILTKTVKGYGMGPAGEGQNITHSQKKMGVEDLKQFRDRFSIPVTDEQLEDGIPPYYLPSQDSPEMEYLRERRARLGGSIPARRVNASHGLKIPGLKAFDAQLKDSGEREFSSTMAFVRILGTLVRDKTIGKRIVPIIPDEARTFGMEGLFRQLGIYAPKGQLYEPEDADQLMYYREAANGQVLQEGINEAGGMSDWMAAATSYSHHDEPMIPFYIFYSMFGFQRIGDLAWASGDIQARGFLLGGTAGRTTLAGEGLQHQDGHSLIMAGTIPNCIAYDPTFAYELAVIIQHGMKRMYADQDNVFYYITVMNENYAHPAMPKGAEQDIIKGLYSFSKTRKSKKPHVQLMGSGAILNEVIRAGGLLKDDWGVNADIWAAPGMNELARDGHETDRWNMLHPERKPRKSHVAQRLDNAPGPVICATDYIRQYSEQIRPWVGGCYVTLGTDGFGRSDTRANLRRHFEVNAHYVAVAALKALADDGDLDHKLVKEAIKKYGIDTEKVYPLYA